MGCASGQKQQTIMPRLQTVNGVLRVTIVNAKIQHQTSSFFAMDPYIKLRISNQSAVTKVVKKGGKQPVFNQSFQFFINSCFKIDGRRLEVQLWDQNKTSDSLIGFGIADLDPMLLGKKPKTDLRIFLNFDLKPAGIINSIIQFKEQQIQLLNFRFQTASIRRKTSTIGSMNCYVQVTIGQEILKTKKQKDTKEMPPVWVDQVLTFNVPKVIKNCLIQIYDDNQLVGECTLKVQDLMKTPKQQLFDEEIDYKDVIAGSLKFQTLLGANPQFSQPRRQYRRKPQQQKGQKKQPQTKQPQKQQKKQQGKQKYKQGQKQKEKTKEQPKPQPKNQTVA